MADALHSSPALVARLLKASHALLERSVSSKATRQASELVGSLLTGLFACEPESAVLIEQSLFGGAAGKCQHCGKPVLDEGWKVCPYCEQRLAGVRRAGLAEQMGSALVAKCLVEGTTLQTGQKEWSGHEAYNHEMLTTREAVVNAMLGFVSRALVGTQAALEKRVHNRWLDALLLAPRAGEFFVGLMNVSLVRVTPGWLSFSEDKRETLRRSSLNLSLVLLSGRIPSEKSYSAVSASPTDDADRNMSVDFLRNVNCKFAFESIVQMLGNTDLFPYGCGLLWNFVQGNPDFFDVVVLKDNCARIVMPLLAFLAIHKSDVKAHGTINLGVFILLSLSSRRAFGVALNLALASTELHMLPKTPLDKESEPSIADALFIVFEMAVASGTLEALHECFLMILCNISPYQKALSMTASVSLMRLFVLFSTRTSLLKTERSHELLGLVMDTIANMLQHQYENNRSLVYVAITYRERFYRLFDIIADKEFTVEQFREDRVPAQPFHTKEWFDTWRRALPARTIAKVLDELVPLLEKMEASHPEAILEEIAKTTVVGVLPPPPPIVIRRSLRSAETDVWIATFLWSVVFNGNKVLADLEPILFQQ